MTQHLLLSVTNDASTCIMSHKFNLPSAWTPGKHQMKGSVFRDFLAQESPVILQLGTCEPEKLLVQVVKANETVHGFLHLMQTCLMLYFIEQ